MKCSTPISSHVHENEEIKPGGKFEILQFYNSLKKNGRDPQEYA